jgi:hypothetical protein
MTKSLRCYNGHIQRICLHRKVLKGLVYILANALPKICVGPLSLVKRPVAEFEMFYTVDDCTRIRFSTYDDLLLDVYRTYPISLNYLRYIKYKRCSTVGKSTDCRAA